jgi:predicted aspartyl protease
MLSLEGEVGARGCVIHIEVQPSSDEFPDPRDRIAAACLAIIDTGADVTCIAPELAERIGLEAHEAEQVFTPGGRKWGFPQSCIESRSH